MKNNKILIVGADGSGLSARLIRNALKGPMDQPLIIKEQKEEIKLDNVFVPPSISKEFNKNMKRKLGNKRSTLPAKAINEGYFIASTKMPGFYIHLPKGAKIEDEQKDFILKKGYVTAAVFDDANSLKLITDKSNLKRVRVKDVL